LQGYNNLKFLLKAPLNLHVLLHATCKQTLDSSTHKYWVRPTLKNNRSTELNNHKCFLCTNGQASRCYDNLKCQFTEVNPQNNNVFSFIPRHKPITPYICVYYYSNPITIVCVYYTSLATLKRACQILNWFLNSHFEK